MNRKQMSAIISPVILIIVMYPLFQFLSLVFHNNWRIGWLLGLAIYWLFWCIGYPLLIIGRKSIGEIIKPQKLNVTIILLVLFPLIMTVVFRLIAGGMTYEKPDVLIFLFFIFSVFGNGFFEEILWRGVYMKLFPNNLLLRIVWPSIWFGLWHYAPGSVNPSGGHVLGLIIGALFLGFYSSFLAKIPNTLWWSIITRTFGGIIMVLV